MRTLDKTGLIACLAAASALAFPAAASAAAPAKDVGVGVVLGDPIGGTAKLWFDDRTAADAGIGFSGGEAALWADLLFHDWTLLPQPKDGRLALYFGGGPQVRTGDDARFGIRAIVGATWRPSSKPYELYAEAGPLFRLTQGGTIDAVGGIGARVYLGR